MKSFGSVREEGPENPGNSSEDSGPGNETANLGLTADSLEGGAREKTRLEFKSCESCAEIKIEKLMTRSVVTVQEDALLEEIFALFEKYRYHTFPVLDSEGKFVGIIDQDIVLEILLFSRIPRAKHTHLAAVRSLGVHAKDIMITHPVTIPPDSSLGYAADLMMKHRFDRVCVTEKEKMVGIISKRDLVKEVCRRRALEKG